MCVVKSVFWTFHGNFNMDGNSCRVCRHYILQSHRLLSFLSTDSSADPVYALLRCAASISKKQSVDSESPAMKSLGLPSQGSQGTVSFDRSSSRSSSPMQGEITDVVSGSLSTVTKKGYWVLNEGQFFGNLESHWMQEAAANLSVPKQISAGCPSHAARCVTVLMFSLQICQLPNSFLLKGLLPDNSSYVA